MLDEYLRGIMNREKTGDIIPETPEEKSRRTGIPIIPKREYPLPPRPTPNPNDNLERKP